MLHFLRKPPWDPFPLWRLFLCAHLDPHAGGSIITLHHRPLSRQFLEDHAVWPGTFSRRDAVSETRDERQVRGEPLLEDHRSVGKMEM